MTRKKRRIREAREMANMGDDEDYGGPEIQTELSQKQIARERKREQSEKEMERRDMSIHDQDMKRTKKRKARGSDALGDSGLFAEEKIAYASKDSKKSEERAKSSYDFRGFNPELAGKKRKTKAHHKFKSKSKYRRR